MIFLKTGRCWLYDLQQVKACGTLLLHAMVCYCSGDGNDAFENDIVIHS